MDEELVLPKDLDEYIRDVIEISTQSTKDNSIHYGFEMRKDCVTNRISLVDNKSGKMELLKEGVFAHNDNFMSHFLSPFLYQFSDNNVIVSHIKGFHQQMIPPDVRYNILAHHFHFDGPKAEKRLYEIF